MKKNSITIIAIVSCLLWVLSCTHDNEETDTRQSSQTRQTTLEDDTQSASTQDETAASPVASFYSVDEADTVWVTPGESQTAQAPLAVHLEANISNPEQYNYICEWRIWSTKDGGSETTPLVTRFEENTDYVLTKSGGYGIKLYVTFTQGTDTIEYESEQLSIVISESKLTCPDGFSPNNDSINDYYKITAQSIVKLDAQFFNRWGQEVHHATLATAWHPQDEPNKLVLWDGKHKGEVVQDGVYFIHLDALGSDDVKYKIKKSISVLTGFLENEDTGGGS